MSDRIRADEWLAALHELSNRSVDGFTMLELSEAAGLSVDSTRLKMAALIRAGKASHVGERTGLSSNGRTIYIPVYRMGQGGGDVTKSAG